MSFYVISSKPISLWNFLTLQKFCIKKRAVVVISRDLGLHGFLRKFLSPKKQKLLDFLHVWCIVEELAGVGAVAVGVSHR